MKGDMYKLILNLYILMVHLPFKSLKFKAVCDYTYVLEVLCLEHGLHLLADHLILGAAQTRDVNPLNFGLKAGKNRNSINIFMSISL